MSNQLLARIAAKRLSQTAEDKGEAAVQPVARRGIQPVAGTISSPTQQTAEIPTADIYKGSIRPSPPDLDADRIKDILDTRDRVSERSRVGVEGYTHVSTLCGDVCKRHYVINVLHGRQDFEAVTGGHRLMWKFGRTAEKHIREHFTTGDTYGFQIYGNWKCPCGRTEHVGTKPVLTRTCAKCDLPLTEYFEEPWFDHENHIVGNPDLGVFVGRYYAPFEIKSASADIWDKLTAPMTEHVNQALLYRYIAEKNGMMVHDKVVIIYAKKEFKWGSPYKVYSVDVTTDRWMGVLQRSLDLAREIKEARDRRLAPPRLAQCTAIDDKRVKKCPAGVTCMNLPS